MSANAWISSVVDVATAGGVGVRVVREPDRHPEHLVADACRALEAHGFVVLSAARDLSRDQMPSVAGRHVALVCFPEDDRPAAAAFVRWLGRTSPRGHLVLLLGWNPPRFGPGNQIDIARERVRALKDIGVRPVWLRKAEVACQRRRFASAERWFRAAITAASGRGDEIMAAQCAARLSSVLIELGHAPRAWALALDLASRLTRPSPRAGMLAVAASALMAGGEFDRAEALLAAVDAEAQILDEEVPVNAKAVRAELHFWRGRFDRVPPPAELQSPSSLGWSGLAAWARGDHEALIGLTDQLGNAPVVEAQDGEVRFWSAVLTALTPLGTRHAPELTARVLASVPPRSARFGALARAVAAEVLIAAARPEDALHVLEGREDRMAAAEALLCDWLRARCRRDTDAMRQCRTRICRAGIDGVLRWGEGEDGMHLIHGLPALLHLVQDADDDQAALKGGCAWLKRQTGADEAAILSADGGRLIAGDGWSVADERTPRATAPIRCGRSVIGQVAARGAESDRLVIEQGVHAVAALLAPAVRSRLDALELAREADRAASEIIGASPAMAAVREAVARAALTRFPVLIEGESGTGKELVARAVHRLSPRRDRPFAAVNCAAISDDLIESELFGHTRGAFTGAMGTRAGIFESAHGGTLFLDEVGELSPRGQAKVLRALQEREIRRVGENAARPIDVRVVAATNVVLAEAVGQGAFRQDLLFRLAVVRIRLPALRDRLEDIPRLAQAFWKPMAADRGVRTRLGADALAALCRHQWPGNVRELQNAIAGLVVSAPARGRVTERHVRQVLALAAPGEAAVSLEAARVLAERRAVASALARHGGRRAAAASELGISRQGLAKALRRLGLAGLDARTGVA